MGKGQQSHIQNINMVYVKESHILLFGNNRQDVALGPLPMDWIEFYP